MDASSETDKKEWGVYMKDIDLWDKNRTIYNDWAGTFLTTSRSGNRYIMNIGL